MEAGCRTFPWLNTLRGQDEKRFKKICHTMREDGGYVEAGENDNLIVQKLNANVGSIGIFGFSYLEENASTLRGTIVDGVEPTFETIASAKYPASRPLFIYVKNAHLQAIPGIRQFAAEYVRESTFGPQGYLRQLGLVPSPDAARQRSGRMATTALRPFSALT